MPAVGTLSIADDSIAEGDDGTTSPLFTVTRFGGSSGAVSAAYIPTPSTATADDFKAGETFTGKVTFADGQTTASVIAGIGGDHVVEADETFTVPYPNRPGVPRSGMRSRPARSRTTTAPPLRTAHSSTRFLITRRARTATRR